MATKKTTIAAEIKVDTGGAEKEVKDLKDDIQGVGTATEGSIAQLKELKKQLKNTAAGSEEFEKLFNQIDDLEDKIKGSKKASSDWIDTLESAGGPLGMVGAALNRAKVATTSFSAALKATGIGLLVSLVAGLAAAFAKNEGAMKKLEPIITQFGRILNGILGAMEPLIDTFIDLATKALPYVTDGFKVAYSAMSSFLQGLGLVGSAVKKFISGDFSGAWDDAKKSVTEFGTRYEDANKRFIAGSKELTDTEKAEQAKRLADQKAFNEKQAAERKAAQEKIDAEEKARLEKAAADAKAYEDFDTELQQRLIEIEDEKAAKETERLEKAAAEAKAYNDFDTKLQQDLLKVEEDATAKKIALADAELQAKLGLANAIGNIAGGLSALFEKGTTAAKIAGLAEIAIGTGVGFIQGLDIAQKGAKATGPAAPFAFPIFYATQIAAVLAAASRAKSVMTQVKGGSGISIPSFGAPSIPSVSANAPLAPSLQTTTLNQAQVNQIGNVAARAYVVESDISGNQERITRLNRAARIS
jgi:ribosomal protein S13